MYSVCPASAVSQEAWLRAERGRVRVQPTVVLSLVWPQALATSTQLSCRASLPERGEKAQRASTASRQLRLRTSHGPRRHLE